MSKSIDALPPGFRDCWDLSFIPIDSTWTSADNALRVTITERLHRTVEEFITLELGRKQLPNPADTLLLTKLRGLIKKIPPISHSPNVEFREALTELLLGLLLEETQLSALDLSRHLSLFRSLGVAQRDFPREEESVKPSLGKSVIGSAEDANLRVALEYFLIKGFYADKAAMPKKLPMKGQSGPVKLISKERVRLDLQALTTKYQPLLAERFAEHFEHSDQPFLLDDPKMLANVSKQVRRSDIFAATKDTSHKDTQKYFGKNAPERLRERAIVHFIAFRAR
jgi:hypothetical protein